MFLALFAWFPFLCIFCFLSAISFVASVIRSWWYRRTSSSSIKRDPITSAASKSIQSCKISIIIPVFNDAQFVTTCISTCIERASDPSRIEFVIADAGHKNENVLEHKLASLGKLDIKLVSSANGRGIAMNSAAKQATGDVFLFLHVDTKLPMCFDKYIRDGLAQKDVALTAFTFSVDKSRAKKVLTGIEMVEWFAYIRSRYLLSPYGDQALAMHRAWFEHLGGFQEPFLMEDLDFVWRSQVVASMMKRRILTLDAKVLCSPRRWEQKGVFKTTILNQIFVLCYSLGVPAKLIFQWYYGIQPIITPTLNYNA